MRLLVVSLLAVSVLGQYIPRPRDVPPPVTKDVPTDLSNDYFAAYAEMGSVREMLARSDAEMRAAYAAMQAHCKGDVIMNPANKRRFVCKPEPTAKSEPTAKPPEPAAKPEPTAKPPEPDAKSEPVKK